MLVFLIFIAFQMNAMESPNLSDIPTVKNDTLTFLKNLSPQFRISDEQLKTARSKIDAGYVYLQQLSEQNTVPIETRCQEIKSKAKNQPDQLIGHQKEYLDKIVALCWAIFDKAVQKGEGFTGGTIVVIDHNYMLYNFLMEYLCYVNPSIQIGKNSSSIIARNKLGYSRISTHFPEIRKLKTFDGQFGIDVRYINGNLQPLLPVNKQHILFGKLPYASKPLTFIKFENFGLGFDKGEMFKHLAKAIEKGEKDIKQTHLTEYSRREDVPKEIEQKFARLVKQLPKDEKKKVLTELSNHFKYIKTFYQEAQRLSLHADKEYTQQAKEFADYIKNKYDYPELRRGNEVIIDLADLQSNPKNIDDNYLGFLMSLNCPSSRSYESISPVSN